MVKKSKADSFIEKHESTINFVIAGLLVIAMFLAFLTVQTYFGQDKGDVVASVDHHPIYQTELDARYESLPFSMQQSYTKELLLEEMIQERLLDQKADRLNIRVNQADIDAAIQEILAQNQINSTQLEQLLQLQGLTRNQFENSMKDQLRLKKLLDREAFGNINITRNETWQYYQENPDEFTVPETVEIRQVLVQNDTEDALMKAEEIRDDTNSYTDLCTVVDRNHPELSDYCGTFNITEYTGVPDEFLEAVFNMRDGRTEVVQTVLGHHVVQRVESYPRRVMGFYDIQENIEQALIQARKQEEYREYLAELREDATIRNYLLDEFVNETFQPELELNEEDVLSCVSERAVLYGARWDAQTKQQISLLGDAMDRIKYVDCAVSESVDEQKAVCDENSIEAYPTWIIDGEQVLGVQTLQELANAAGC